MKRESILNQECSVISGASGETLTTVNLLDWLSIPNQAEVKKQLRVRSVPAEKRELLKRGMSSIMASGRFSGRGKKCLIKHSGFIAIDIDKKHNLHIRNYSEIKKQISKLSCVAYCGLSVSGTGYWALIAIAYPEKHEDHYKFVQEYLASKGLIIDPSCKNVDRLRFYCYDADGYINHSAKPLRAYYKPPRKNVSLSPKKNYGSKDIPVWTQYNRTNDFFGILEKHRWKIDSTQGEKTYFTRPGKSSGVSAEFDRGIGSLYVFTSNAAPFEALTAYTPFQVYTILEHDGNFKAAANALTSQAPVALKRSIPHPVRAAVSQNKPTNVTVLWSTIGEPVTIMTPPITTYTYNPVDKPNRKKDWTPEIQELETFFDSASIPAKPISLDQCTIINNPHEFIQSHLATVSKNNGNPVFLPYLNRLNQFKTLLK